VASDLLGDALAAGFAGAVLGGVPSTAYALATGRDPLEATVAAGTLLLPHERRPGRLLLAGAATHVAISLGWAAVLASTLPRRRTVVAGAAVGLAIAVLDLGVLGRRFPRLRALPLGPQLADHAAYGAVVGAVLARRRAHRMP
jgi:hypothetical protein